MRFAITGATGLVGRRVVRESLRRGHDVVALVREPGDGRLPAHAKLTERAWSLDRAGEIDLGTSHIDALIHLAAHIPPRMDDPSFAERCFQDNALAVRDIVASAALVGGGHIVYASTASLYVNQGRPAQEGDAVYPGMHAPYYLASKLAGEAFARHGADGHGVSLTTLRIGSVFGPGMRPESVVARFLSQSAAGVAHDVRHRAHTADFVYVDDVAHAITTAAESRAPGTFNIGSGVATSLDRLSRTVALLFEREAVSNAQAEHRALSEPSGFPALDIRRAIASLGLSPTPLEDGLRFTLKADWPHSTFR